MKIIVGMILREVKLDLSLFIWPFFVSIAGISAVFIYPMTKAPIILISLGCASSAILSGIEWHLGYKSKALNKLFEATVLLVLLILVRLFTW